MSVNSSADHGKLENNENVPVNVKWHIKDQKNYSGSQEIFSGKSHSNVKYFLHFIEFFLVKINRLHIHSPMKAVVF